MKILALTGSPNKNGSSNLLSSEFIRGAEEAGHSVRVVDAAHAHCADGGTGQFGRLRAPE